MELYLVKLLLPLSISRCFLNALHVTKKKENYSKFPVEYSFCTEPLIEYHGTSCTLRIYYCTSMAKCHLILFFAYSYCLMQLWRSMQEVLPCQGEAWQEIQMQNSPFHFCGAKAKGILWGSTNRCCSFLFLFLAISDCLLLYAFTGKWNFLVWELWT